MIFKIRKDVLFEGLQKVQNIVTSKAVLPILSNILIECAGGKIRLTATDLDVGITCAVPVDIQESGSITVPAKRFFDIVKELPGEEVQVCAKKNNLVTIETKSCHFRIMGLAPEEFPRLPEFKDKEVISIDQGDLKRMLQLTSFAVSMDETRYILNGILFKISKGVLELVATDGKRLAVAEKKISSPVNKDLQMIVPIKAIHEINRNLGESGELSLVVSANQALFELEKIAVISRLIEGEFPDYRQVIPSTSTSKIKINREQFLLAVRRAALLSTVDYQGVKLEVFKNKLVVSKSTPDIGESREEVPMEYNGKEMAIGFNPVYIIDLLKNIDEDSLEFELTDTEKPGVVRLDGYLYIVLPMRLA